MHQKIEGLGIRRHPQEPIVHKAHVRKFLAKIARHKVKGLLLEVL
jgi:hypothetical protein